jgi:hypothetical protein
MKKTNFSPLAFLASLGAGGITAMFFAFLNYTHKHGEGLVSKSDLNAGNINNGVLLGSEIGMIVFALIHFVLTVFFLKQLWSWLKTEKFQEVLNSPLKNSILVAPFISVAMTMNVFIGTVRFFMPVIDKNFQALMLPALIFWLSIWIFLMVVEIKLLKISFIKGFDIDKINFGWLLHPFALGMVTVTGTGIAAMAKNPMIADTAAFFSLVSGTMGFFLLVVKLVMIFKSHFAAKSLPDKFFLPSFLIVVPNITLYALSAFRFGHYLEHSRGFELGVYYFLVIITAFAFEVWYMIFGLTLLKDYFKKHFWKKEFYLAQWGLVCPFVAFGVLGSFVYKLFLPTGFFYWFLVALSAMTSILFLILLSRHFKCCLGGEKGKENWECANN